MALLSTQSLNHAGLNPSFAAAAGGGDTVTPGERTFLVVKNGGGAPITVTIATPGTVAGLAIADGGGSVTNGQERWYGPLRGDLYADPADGLVHVTYSGVTTVTVGAFTVPGS